MFIKIALNVFLVVLYEAASRMLPVKEAQALYSAIQKIRKASKYTDIKRILFDCIRPLAILALKSAGCGALVELINKLDYFIDLF